MLDCESDAQWAALAAEIALPWALDPRLASASTRAAARQTLTGHLHDWLVGLGAEAALSALSACARAGVPASRVLNEADVLGLEPLLAGGFWQGVDREPVGFHLYPTIAYSSGGERPLTELPAPLLGEHTESILEAMGYAAPERARLAAEGVTGTTLAAAR